MHATFLKYLFRKLIIWERKGSFNIRWLALSHLTELFGLKGIYCILILMGIYSGNVLTSVIQNFWSPQKSEKNLLN